jgi:ubiquitin carboxyl-terminal hydrolase L5
VQEAICPDHVWFANQTHEFSCATTSLLNIVNNIPDVDIGEQLQSFKDFTKLLTPAQRGDQIGNFEFVKQIHNSFARKMDMLNIDLGMENAYDERNKSKKKAAPLKGKKGKVTTEEDYVADDNAFHFIAYVPIEGDVWKLDGLDRQPSKYGKIVGDDWLNTVVPRIEQRMDTLSSGGIEFGLLSLVKDPIVGYQEELRKNMVCYMELFMELVRRDAAAQETGSTEPSFMKSVVSDHSEAYKDMSGNGISEAEQIELGIPPSGLIDQQILAEFAEQLETASTSELLALRIKLKNEYPAIKRSIQDELAQARDDRRRATERRNEYGPLIHTWLKMLAEQEGVIRDLIDETR